MVLDGIEGFPPTQNQNKKTDYTYTQPSERG